MVARWLGTFVARRRPRGTRPERLQARGWDLSLLGLALFTLILAVVVAVSRLT
jgi:hypothetical protein